MRIPCSQALRRGGRTVLGALLLSIIPPGLPATHEARAQVPGSPIGIRLQNPPPAAGDRWPLMFTWNRNKVNWWRFDWRQVELPSSTIYYYEQAEPVARITAALVTDSDRRLQSRFGYDLQRYTADKTIPKIIYTSHHTFEQTNTIAQNIPEGVGGFTEFIKGRVVFPFTGSNAEFRHVLEHENAHAHMIHKLKHTFRDNNINDTSRLLPMLWFSEGLAEYHSSGYDRATGIHRMDPETEMYLRDGLLNDTLPTIRTMRLYPDYIRVYKHGHALVQYLGARWGSDHLDEMLSRWHHLYPNRHSFSLLRRRSLDSYDLLNPGVGYHDPPFVRVGEHDIPLEKEGGRWRARTAEGLVDTLEGRAVIDRVAATENLELDGVWYRIIYPAGDTPTLYHPERGVLRNWEGERAEQVIRGAKQDYEKAAYRHMHFDRLLEWWFDIGLDDLGTEWHEDVRAHYTPWLQGRTRVGDYTPLGRGATELWPTASSDGALVLYKAYRQQFVYELMLLDRASGYELRLVRDNTPEVESLHVLSEGGDIYSLGEGRYRIVFTAKRRHRDVLYLQDVLRHPDGRLEKSGRLRIGFDPAPSELISLSGVRFAGAGDRVLFTGLHLDGMEDIYLADLESEEFPRRLTVDLASDRTPVLWGERIVFASDRASNPDHFNYQLFSMNLDGSGLVQLTESAGNDRNPVVGTGGRLYFQSDATGVTNIFEWSLRAGIRQVTDVATGVFSPSPVGPDSLIVSGFHNAEFSLFLIPTSGPQTGPGEQAGADRPIGALGWEDASAPRWVGRPWPEGRLPTADSLAASWPIDSRAYRPSFSLDDFYAAGEFGGIQSYNAAMFGAEIRFSDLLGEHQVGLAVWNGPRRGIDDLSWMTSYWNQKRRIRWGGVLYRTGGIYFNLVRQDFYLRERAGLNTRFRYPFNRFSHLDLVAGVASERRRLGTMSGAVTFREVELGLGLTRDVSTWGPQGPHRGWVFSTYYNHIFNASDRYATFSNYIVSDLRGYLPLHRWVVAAGRVAFGESGGLEPEFFFLGGGFFLRGYQNLYSLYGSSYRLVNTEVRLQPMELMGLRPPRMFERTGWPIQTAFFAEAGQTRWKGGRIGPLGSAGVSLRLTLALPFVIEYAWYRERFWEQGPYGRGLLVTLLF